jgi:NADH-quinone oxidoreductase subunit C
MPVTTAIESIIRRVDGVTTDAYKAQHRMTAPVDSIHEVLAMLHGDYGFDLLVDVTCVDYLNYRDADHRFGLVYVLSNTDNNARLIVRTYVDDPEPTVPSVTDLWKGADWMEREVWDMFGVRFADHADLRRILLPDEFAAHPLRKDYPLQGRGERHNFPVLTRDHE